MAVQYPEFEAGSRQELRDWLAAHHAASQGIWLITGKKAAGSRYVSWDEIVEEALCFGWIDSLPGKVDDMRSKLLLTPRKKGSVWSALNKRRIEKLLAEGLMTPSGLAVIERAKEDGTWTLLDEVEQGIEPPDLAEALDAIPAARAAWDGFPLSARKGILQWIHMAKTPATRSKRIAEAVEKASRGERALFSKKAPNSPSD